MKVRRVFNDSKGRYGSPRVYQALRREGLVVGENRVARVMREWGMKARVARVYRPNEDAEGRPESLAQSSTGGRQTGRSEFAVEQRCHLHQAGQEICVPGGCAGSVFPTHHQLAAW
ncbi:putative ISCps9, transposase orfB [Marinobacter nauticus ATCC 49840]|nr:putative ISCps9, transposase orfB [Marinobacter nauticus ATCC 49840]